MWCHHWKLRQLSHRPEIDNWPAVGIFFFYKIQLFVLFPFLCGVAVWCTLFLHIAWAYTPFSLISSLTLANHLLLAFLYSSSLVLPFPSYVMFLSSYHMPIPLHPPFLDFLWDSLTFFVHVILCNSTHPSWHSHFCNIQFIFPRLLQCRRTTPQTLSSRQSCFQFFLPLCTMWETSACSSPSSANFDTRHFTKYEINTLCCGYLMP